MTINVYVVTVETTERDWGKTSFEVKGVWPTFEKALEYLQQKKSEQDKLRDDFRESKTRGIEVRNDSAWWDYGDWDGNYEYRIDMTEYHNSED